MLRRRSDGRWFFISIGLNDPAEAISDVTAQEALASALLLMAKT
jgi:hypothetical protein